MISDLFIGIFLSVLLGALVGVQREMKIQKGNYQDFAGFRTFTFICLLGFLIGYLSFEVLNNPYLIIISIFSFFFLLIISYYVLSKKYKNYVSETSQISAMLVFLVGLFISLKMYYVSITVAIVITLFLVLGTSLHNFAKRLNSDEVFATLKFAIISFLILPILPNKSYGFLDVPFLSTILLNFFSYESLKAFEIFNLYHIWLMVVFISGITYIGYILIKVLGSRKGIFVTGVLGGLMSSTALTSSFSIESKKLKTFSSPLAIGITLASSIMFFRIIFEVAIVNWSLLGEVIFLSIMGFVGLLTGLYFYFRNSEKKHNGNFEQKSPFTLGPAIGFALFFLVILFLSKLFTILLGDEGLYLVAFFSGFADVDVITLTLSKLALDGVISNNVAATGIFIAAVANTLFKGAIAYFLGSRKLSKKVLTTFILIILTGLVTLIFI